ncbi:MAG: chaperone NapD [Hyphomicrobiaceae bacterium]|jgi:periplasmic nitrate reductase NapD
MPSSRRAFLAGQGWPADAAADAQCGRQVEIASLVVSARPQHLDAVAQAILALGNGEIHARDPKGKLIVVLEEESQGAIGAKINVICGLPQVLSALMVFQASDRDENIA